MEMVSAIAKSGRPIQVCVVSLDELAPEHRGLEARQYRAAEMAAQAGCGHYRVVDATGAVLSTGRAAQPLLSRDEAAARSGPARARHDW